MAGEERGGGHMGGMFGINIDIGHCGHDCREHYIPLLGGIFVYSNFNALEYVDLLRQGFESSFETGGHIGAFGIGAGEFECYDMFYHFLGRLSVYEKIGDVDVARVGDFDVERRAFYKSRGRKPCDLPHGGVVGHRRCVSV